MSDGEARAITNAVGRSSRRTNEAAESESRSNQYVLVAVRAGKGAGYKGSLVGGEYATLQQVVTILEATTTQYTIRGGLEQGLVPGSLARILVPQVRT